MNKKKQKNFFKLGLWVRLWRSHTGWLAEWVGGLNSSECDGATQGRRPILRLGDTDRATPLPYSATISTGFSTLWPMANLRAKSAAFIGLPK